MPQVAHNRDTYTTQVVTFLRFLSDTVTPDHLYTKSPSLVYSNARTTFPKSSPSIRIYVAAHSPIFGDQVGFQALSVPATSEWRPAGDSIKWSLVN